MAGRNLSAELALAIASPRPSVRSIIRVAGTDPLRKRRRFGPYVEEPDSSLQDRAPELVDYLTRRGQASEQLQQQHAALQAAHKLLQQQLRTAQDVLDEEKAKAASSRADKEVTVAEGERTRNDLEAALMREIARTTSLQSERQQAEAAEAQALEKASAAEQMHEQARAQLQAETSSLSSENRLLRREVDRAREAKALLEKEILTIKNANSTVQDDELKETQSQHKQAVEETKILREHNWSLNMQLANVMSKNASALTAASSPAASKVRAEQEADIIQNLREELRAQEQEVAEARRLKLYVRNVKVLEEQLHAAKARADRAELSIAEGLQLESRAAELEHSLQQWQAVSQVAESSELAEKLAERDQEADAAATAVSAAQGQVTAAEGKIARLEQAQAESSEAAESLKQDKARAAAEAARLERSVQLLIKEKDNCLQLLDSYKEEATSQGATAGEEVARKQLQIQGLQEAEQGLQEHVKQLVAELSQVKGSLETQLQSVIVRANRAEAKASRLEAENDSLGGQIADLQERVGKGEYNQATTRVLHLVHNPEAEAFKEQQAARIANMQAEIKALQNQLHSAEGTNGQTGSEDQSRSQAVASAEMHLLKLKMTDAEKRHKRLTEVFTKQVNTFREACYTLFGYRVDMASQPSSSSTASVFVLKPQHADSKQAELVFQLRQDGHMELVPNEYSQRKLKNDVETYINRFKSIPAFTANLTMELFQKQAR